MAGKKNELGPTGQTAADNVKRIRERQRITYAELSRTLQYLGRSIPPLGLRRIEEGERRIDVDDLVALSAALGVSPITLLMPDTTTDTELVEASGVKQVPAGELWQWMRTEMPIGNNVRQVTENLEFQWRAKPAWMHAELVSRSAGDAMTPEAIRAVADEVERRQADDRGDS
ncbi:helix-turn-helix domain-containing protein [Rhodococcus aetherivorans]|uniref:helix-turn-helix domain-containing protein n=1 Tax=Rhodococcus aetherivorans TaxID=191292 RepID=UPI0029493DF3|nr:helix-turn-helix transcriptional regulator [Rhodococcus aetherivorans]MDV6293299.1 helix-turn-helix transcriptional regulator [Rhodococcus aetherivorans]